MKNMWNIVVGFIRRNKIYVSLVLGGFVAFLVNAIIFYPGYMTFDSIMQLSQALGATQVSDWHPPIMALLWRALIWATGGVSSMLLFQLFLLWAALVMLAVCVYKWTGKLAFSVAILLTGFLPFVLNISGVIWKDGQMAFSLLLASVLILVLIKNQLSRTVRYSFLGIIGALIIYACLVRHNAFFAAVPLMFLAVHYGLELNRLRSEIVAVVVACGGIAILNGAFLAIITPKSTHPTTAVMVDDIVNVLSKKEIDATAASQPVKITLKSAIERCNDKELSLNSIDYCTDGARDMLSIDHHEDVASIWKSVLKSHTGEYLGFRFQAFVAFFFSPDSSSSYWAKGILKNDFGLGVKYPDLGDATKIYVKDFGYKHFSFFYQPWFWAGAAVVLLWWSRRLVRMRLFVTLMSVSSLVYVASYVPVVIGMDYRYVYWSMIAVMIAFCAIMIERFDVTRPLKRNKKPKKS